MRMHDLDCDLTIKAGIYSDIDGGHTAGSDEPLELISPINKFAGEI